MFHIIETCLLKIVQIPGILADKYAFWKVQNKTVLWILLDVGLTILMNYVYIPLPNYLQYTDNILFLLQNGGSLGRQFVLVAISENIFVSTLLKFLWESRIQNCPFPSFLKILTKRGIIPEDHFKAVLSSHSSWWIELNHSKLKYVDYIILIHWKIIFTESCSIILNVMPTNMSNVLRIQ